LVVNNERQAPVSAQIRYPPAIPVAVDSQMVLAEQVMHHDLAWRTVSADGGHHGATWLFEESPDGVDEVAATDDALEAIARRRRPERRAASSPDV
jgi:hypothetical protein